MVRSAVDGEITETELRQLLSRNDILSVPHTTSFFSSGCDFDCIPLDLMTPLIEVYSRWGTSEYFGNPKSVRSEAEGGFWRDALEKGARMGCICGSDDHTSTPGLVLESDSPGSNLQYSNPGLTAILVEELTRDAIFEALAERRCYGVSGARILIDFRINDNIMGIEFDMKEGEKRDIYIHVIGESGLKTVTLIKNGRDRIIHHLYGRTEKYEELIYDYKAERDTDYYYLRVEQHDGRMAWTSPIWINNVK
jgi:hypothetical protein